MLEQIRAAVARARFRDIDYLNRKVSSAWGEGILHDHDAQSLLEALQVRRRVLATHVAPASKRLAGERLCRAAPRSPDRERSICRRRSVAASGAVPSVIAGRFTLCEVAVLSIVAAEVKRRGRCELPIDAVAAMAGTSRSVVKRALRLAADLGLVTVRERRRAGLKSLPNVVAIVSAEWRAWLRLADRGPKSDHRGYQLFKRGRNAWSNADAAGKDQRSASEKRREKLGEGASRSDPPS